MPPVGISVRLEIDDFEAGLDRMLLRVHDATRQATDKAAQLVVGAAKRKATHRPGPNVITGIMRAKIAQQGRARSDGDWRWRAEVAPTGVQSRRLELGFMNMRDSLGRLYHQKPYPFLRPGQTEALPKVEAMLVRQWAEAVR